ncbi:MAG TPA: lipoate--protein ligase family protein [Gemmatimonadaceae bacterium]|nr:lipoate--protein ligase family protein [Gemmatimonadaceae bacterium]
MQPRRSLSRWRLLLAAPRSGAENMARDTALLERAARTGETVFSIYSWEKPTLSFGRHQAAAGHYDAEAIRAASVDVVRRPTGGRAILHHREVTYSVTAPLAGEPLRAAYERINEVLIDGLARLGVAATLAAPSHRTPPPNARPCFESPVEGEVVAAGRKLVGSAQWRDERALLQHGSILVDDDQSALPSFSLSIEGAPTNEPVPRPATLSALLGRSPATGEVADMMFQAVKSIEDAQAMTIEEDEIRDETLRHVPRYLDQRWTWRR